MKLHLKVPGLLIQISLGRTIHNSESSRYNLAQASATGINEATEVAGHYFSEQVVRVFGTQTFKVVFIAIY